ncbi:ester cyclase [Alphaproteobacteria bacterium]|nr:ester cyclase [Alphaproteobacteria bacterium]
MTIETTAKDFFEACETGTGWEVCNAWCHKSATFSCQSDALADTSTVEGYADWMKGLLTPIPDGRYELKGFAVDAQRNTVLAFAVFHGTQTGEGGPVPATGKTLAADYVYSMEFDGDKISHLTKIWNDAQSMRQLGWA